MISVGQLRRWRGNAGSPGEVFLVTEVNPPNTNGDVFIDYVMEGERHWDDDEWIQTYSEVISETR